jgi:electron transport complex protein RnfG
MTRAGGSAFLVVTAIAAAAMLSWTNDLTRERIADNELAQRLAALRAVLPATGYDNEPHLDVVYVTSPELLGDTKPLPVYLARRNGKPVAAVLTAIAPNGYSGAIYLLVGIGVDAKVIAVRVTAHTETPGLGDRIEAARSDWIDRFSGVQATDPLARAWVLDKDGGDFDHITGATVTSHAVVSAVRNAVIYFDANRDQFMGDDPLGDELLGDDPLGDDLLRDDPPGDDPPGDELPGAELLDTDVDAQ